MSEYPEGPEAGAHAVPARPDRPCPSCTLVIFGGWGDLARRKLIPAVYYLTRQGLLHDCAVVGVGRREQDHESYRGHLEQGIREYLGAELSGETWAEVRERIYYHLQSDFMDPASYAGLAERLATLDQERGREANYLFYLATPPSFFGEIATQLGRAGLAAESGGRWRRVIIEKPFGRDLASARELNRELQAAFQEDQIYRIDHYLGKETVQNILTYRFANATVEPIWNHLYVDHVQISVAESLGVEDRAGYYEEAGALRDMVPNHLFELLAVIAMEPANSFDADAIRNEKTKVLRAVQPLAPEQVLTHVVRGQYGPGVDTSGSRVPGYRDEPGVRPSSSTETFVAMKLKIDSWRWAGVPFYLRTGKRMPARYTEIVVQFRHAPQAMFQDSPVVREKVPPNRLVLRIQPNEGIGMCFNAKVPGPIPHLGAVEMDFSYADHFGTTPTTGYETLIYDCMTGDATLFKRADHIEASWWLVQPILDVWTALPPRDFPNYAAGTWGPRAADVLLERDGCAWKPWRPGKA